MTVSMKQVRGILDAEEPDYRGLAALGPEALPHLKKLVTGGDGMLASKATYGASLIQDDRAVDVLLEAAESDNVVVRVAAAAAARNVSSAASGDLLENFINDDDPGVRRRAIKSVGKNATDALAQKIAEMAATDEDPSIREMCGEALSRMSMTPQDKQSDSPKELDGMGGGTLDEPSSTESSDAKTDGMGGGSLDGSPMQTSSDVADGQGGGELPSRATNTLAEVEGFGGGSFQ